MKLGGSGILITTLPSAPASTYLLSLSKILTSYPGIAFVTEPGKVG